MRNEAALDSRFRGNDDVGGERAAHPLDTRCFAALLGANGWLLIQGKAKLDPRLRGDDENERLALREQIKRPATGAGQKSLGGVIRLQIIPAPFDAEADSASLTRPNWS
jgi:hypothetical protein